jgi:hypothetical protein
LADINPPEQLIVIAMTGSYGQKQSAGTGKWLQRDLFLEGQKRGQK